MSGQIFVPLRKRDRVEAIMPYLAFLARPGMRVVFLTRYREKVSWMEVQLTAMQTGPRVITAITALTANASREAHLRWVEERIRPARQALQQKGTTVTIRCYTGSLRKGMTSLSDAGTDTIVLLSNRGIILSFIVHVKSLLGPFRASHTAPIMLLRPRHKVDAAS